jgi:hypothetical protein
MSEEKRQVMYFSYQIRPHGSLRILDEWNIPPVYIGKYLSVIFDKKLTPGIHTKTIEAKAFRTFIAICFHV